MIEFGTNDKTNGYVFLLKTEETENNCIKFTVALSRIDEKTADTANDIPAVQTLIEKSAPLRPDANEIYEIIFDNYIIHQTRNESFCSWDDYEIREGTNFIIFTKSRLLDTLPQLIDCELTNIVFSPNKAKHYGIYCLDHIIDIISCYEPTIVKLNNFGGTP